MHFMKSQYILEKFLLVFLDQSFIKEIIRKLWFYKKLERIYSESGSLVKLSGSREIQQPNKI